MQPISHHELSILIKTALEKRNLKLEVAAYTAGIDHRLFARMIGGITPYTPEILAPLGRLLNIDYGAVYARYAFGRYIEEKIKVIAPRLAPEKRVRFSSELDILAGDIVRQNPATTPTGLLVQYLMTAAPGLQEPMAVSAIKHAIMPHERTGDYDR